ncbi:hypothetical protein BH09VER1_BH09VER1_07410 [soil metagenome]
MKRAYGAGFSLVEVILAIGVASFCLLAILGLFSVAFRTGMQARDTMAVAGASVSLMGEIRARTNYTFPATNYYDNDGQKTNVAGALYECVVTRTTVSSTNLPDVGTNLSQVSMSFTWPASVSAAQRKNTNIVYGNLP